MKILKIGPSTKSNFFLNFAVTPSTKRAITPMFFEQIEKFQCLKSSTAQGPHVSRVHKHVLKLVNFLVQNLLKPHMFDLGTHSA